MRKMTSLLVAAAFVAAGPAFAQATNDTATATTNAAEGDPALGGAGAGAVPTDAGVNPTMNGLTAGSAPETAAPGTIDTSYGEPGDGEAGDDDSFPWGLLGLIGLAGLIPRKRRDDNVNRTDRGNR